MLKNLKNTKLEKIIIRILSNLVLNHVLVRSSVAQVLIRMGRSAQKVRIIFDALIPIPIEDTMKAETAGVKWSITVFSNVEPTVFVPFTAIGVGRAEEDVWIRQILRVRLA